MNFKGHFSIKLMELQATTNINATFGGLEPKSINNFEFDMKNEGLMSVLVGFDDVHFNLSIDSEDKFHTEYLINKIDDVKSVHLVSQSQVRHTSDTDGEFDVLYEKVKANGELLSNSGVFKYNSKNSKNFNGNLDIPNSFRLKFIVENERQTDEIFHILWQLNFAHLDYDRIEHDYKLSADKTESLSKLKLLMKHGNPDTFDQFETNDFYFHLEGDRTVPTMNSLLSDIKGTFKINDYKFNERFIYQLDHQTNSQEIEVSYNSSYKLKRNPTMFSQTFKFARSDLRNHEFSYSMLTDNAKTNKYIKSLQFNVTNQENGHHTNTNISLNFKTPLLKDESNKVILKSVLNRAYGQIDIDVEQTIMPVLYAGIFIHH
jgi:hypothetical protein